MQNLLAALFHITKVNERLSSVSLYFHYMGKMASTFFDISHFVSYSRKQAIRILHMSVSFYVRLTIALKVIPFE